MAPKGNQFRLITQFMQEESGFQSKKKSSGECDLLCKRSICLLFSRHQPSIPEIVAVWL